MKKSSKRISRRNKQNLKTLVCVVMIQVFILTFFVLAFLDTAKADSKNTYTVEDIIVDIYIKDIPNKPSMLYIKTLENSYRFTWKNYADNTNISDVDDLRNQLLEESQIVFTVLKNSHKTSSLYGNTLQVVGIKSDLRTYYDVSNYNQWQTNNRVVVIVVFIFSETILIIALLFLLFLNRNKPIKLIRGRFLD